MVQVRIIIPLLCFLFLGLTFFISKPDPVQPHNTASTIAAREFQTQFIQQMENTSKWLQPRRQAIMQVETKQDPIHRAGQ